MEGRGGFLAPGRNQVIRIGTEEVAAASSQRRDREEAPREAGSKAGTFAGGLGTWGLCQEGSMVPQRQAKSRSSPSGCYGLGAGLW